MGVIISVFNVTRVHRGGPLLGGQRSGLAAWQSQKQHQRELHRPNTKASSSCSPDSQLFLPLLHVAQFSLFAAFRLWKLMPQWRWVQHYLWISVHFKTCRLTHQGLICKANFQASGTLDFYAVSSRFWSNICKFLPCLQWSLRWF